MARKLLTWAIAVGVVVSTGLVIHRTRFRAFAGATIDAVAVFVVLVPGLW